VVKIVSSREAWRRRAPGPADWHLDHEPAGAERGSALLCALLVISLLTTLGAGLVVVVTTETLVDAHYRASQQALYAAEAGAERAIGDIRALGSWQAVPAPGSVASSADLNDGAIAPRLADGSTLDLARLTTRRQAESDGVYPSTPDRPQWRLFAHASLQRITDGHAGPAPPYVIVWIADDPDDLDGDPARDSNDVLLVRSQVFGVRGASRSVEVTVRRQSTIDGAGAGGAMRSDVTVIAWREVR
jgi:hypothetical protein